MPKQNHSAMICSTKYGKCTCCPYDQSNSTASSDGRRRWVVTRRSNAEESRETLEATVVDSSIRLCSICRTSNTPLWRSGPDGPMSLCNACGIRYRKRKRSEGMEDAEARQVVAMTGNKESKPDSNAEESKKGQREKPEKLAMPVSEEGLRRRQREKQEKILMVLLRHRREVRSWRQRWFPARSSGGGESDEVAEAALLLLSLSCGISVHY